MQNFCPILQRLCGNVAPIRILHACTCTCTTCMYMISNIPCFQVITHETCHLFGLAHCVYFDCAMNESSSVAEALAQPIVLCPVCLRKLHKCALFDLRRRYQAMLDFFVELDKQFESARFQNVAHWLAKCLRYLNSADPPPTEQFRIASCDESSKVTHL